MRKWKLQSKLAVSVAAIIVGVSLAGALWISWWRTRILTASALQDMAMMAENTVRRISPFVYSQSWANVLITLSNDFANREDLVYCRVTDPLGRVLLSTLPEEMESGEPFYMKTSVDPDKVLLDRTFQLLASRLRQRLLVQEARLERSVVHGGRLRGHAGERILDVRADVIHGDTVLGHLRMGFSRRPVLESVRQNRRTFLVLEGCLLVAVLGAIFLVVRREVRPLQLMTEKLRGVFAGGPEKMASGVRALDLSPVQATTREVSDLKDAFERMQHSLMENYERLEAHQERLQELVEERTADLLRTNEALQKEVKERTRSEQALRESEERFSYLLETIPLVAVRGFGPDGTIHYWNRSCEEIYGYRAEEVIGKNVWQVLNPAGRPVVDRGEIRALPNTHRVSEPREKTYLRKDGTPVDVFSSTVVLRRQDERPEFFAFDIDLTPIRRMEEELHKAKRLEAIGYLAAGIAHDFNNLLTAILGNINMARLWMPPASPEAERLLAAEKASLRAKDLTQKLITFSEGGTPRKLETSLKGLIEDAASLALAGSNVRCESRIEEGLDSVEADPDQLRHALYNVLKNAREAMARGGTVQVEASRVSLEADEFAELERMGLQCRQVVRIQVRDNGQGMPLQVLDKIFDPYFSTKPRGTDKGQGLGLTIVHSIVRRHGGAVTVDSTPGLGTTVSIYLPVSVHPAAAAPVKEGTP
jgi:PAS domain S-box-containing protein